MLNDLFNDLFYDICIAAGTIKDSSRISQIRPPNANLVLLIASGVVDDDTIKTRICFLFFSFFFHICSSLLDASSKARTAFLRSSWHRGHERK